MFQKNANKRDRQTTVFPTKWHYQKTPAVAVIKRHCTRSQTRGDKLFRFSRRREKGLLFLLSPCSLSRRRARESGRSPFRSFLPQMKDSKPRVIANTHIRFGNLPLQTYGQIFLAWLLAVQPPFLSFSIFTLSFSQAILLFLFFKWIVHPKMKNLSFIHAQVDPNPFCSVWNTIPDILDIYIDHIRCALLTFLH